MAIVGRWVLEAAWPDLEGVGCVGRYLCCGCSATTADGNCTAQVRKDGVDEDHVEAFVVDPVVESLPC